jgi:hypothetical protein
MRSGQAKSNSLQRLKKKLNSKHCDLCGSKLFPSAFIIQNLDSDNIYVECVSCFTIYDEKLEIDSVGLPEIHGVS